MVGNAMNPKVINVNATHTGLTDTRQASANSNHTFIVNHRECSGGTVHYFSAREAAQATTHFKALDAPESFRLRCIKTLLSYSVKQLAKVPRFNPLWIGITGHLNAFMRWCASNHDHDIRVIPVSTIPLFLGGNEMIDHEHRADRSLSVFHYPAQQVSRGLGGDASDVNQADLGHRLKNEIKQKQLIFFCGGGYLFHANGAKIALIKQYTQLGFNVWVPDYTLLHSSEGREVSRRTLEEANAVYEYVLNLQKCDAISIGLTGDSAGADIITRLMKYRASKVEPIKSPINLVSPSYLDVVNDVDLLNADPKKEYLLPAFQIVGLKTTLRHKPIQSYLSRVDWVETFQGTRKVRITAAEGELLQNNAERLHQQLIEAGVDSRLVVYQASIHSGELLADFAPEFQARLSDSIEWMSHECI